jgi:hypothetical protein
VVYRPIEVALFLAVVTTKIERDFSMKKIFKTKLRNMMYVMAS